MAQIRIRNCTLCGKSFELPGNTNTKWCSEACRFWAKADRSAGRLACWPWTGAIFSKTGYGAFGTPDGKTTTAPRVAYRLAYGDIPTGMYVCHRCDNRACVNPAHLYAGSPKENVADVWARGKPAGQFAEKTHCKHGHPFSGDNLRINAAGQKECRECRRQGSIRQYEARKARLAAASPALVSSGKLTQDDVSKEASIFATSQATCANPPADPVTAGTALVGQASAIYLLLAPKAS